MKSIHASDIPHNRPFSKEKIRLTINPKKIHANQSICSAKIAAEKTFYDVFRFPLLKRKIKNTEFFIHHFTWNIGCIQSTVKQKVTSKISVSVHFQRFHLSGYFCSNFRNTKRYRPDDEMLHYHLHEAMLHFLPAFLHDRINKS
jgi:hypothetical protein